MPIVSIFPSGGGGGGIKLSSIAIITPPVKVEYTAGDIFDPTGMEVSATYSNGSTAVATGYSFSPSAPLVDGTQSVTIQYTESGVTKTASQAITVIHKLSSIGVTTNPTKTVYEYSDAFDPAGMIVTATYSDGVTEEVTGYQWEPLTFQSLGSQTVGIAYSDGNVQMSAMIFVDVERKTIPEVPTQSGTLTYTGEILTPLWDGYDPLQVTIGGVASGMNAGDYTATVTPTANYRWRDGTTEEKSAVWSIGKAAGSLTLSKTSMSLTAAAKVGTIAVTRAGTGAITAVSSNTAIATVSVSGTTVTVTGKTTGSATVTVSVGEDANYTAPEDKTCSVSVQFYNPVLNDNSWEEISQASASGEAANLWSVGDAKQITINGQIGNTNFSNLAIHAFIIGFNHNSAKEGSNKTHFKIGKIGMKQVALADSKYGTNVSTTGYFSMNSTNTNAGGWNGSQVRKNVLGNQGTPTAPPVSTMLAAIPPDLRAKMKPCTKYSDNTGGGSDTASYVTASTDYLFLLSEFEYHGVRAYANSAEQNYQKQYAYYQAGNPKVHYKHNAQADAAYVLCRSVYPGYSYTFCLVNTNGTATTAHAYYSYCVAPGFCV